MTTRTTEKASPTRRLLALLIAFAAATALSIALAPGTALAAEAEVTVSADKEIACPGETITLTWTVKNVSDSDLEITFMTELHDGRGLDFWVSTLSPGGSYSNTFTHYVTEQDLLDGLQIWFEVAASLEDTDSGNTFKANGSCTVDLGPYVDFVNYDDTILQSGPGTVGQTPAYAGEEPTKPETAEHTYAFAGWDPEVGPVAYELDPYAYKIKSYRYKATYDESPRPYAVTWLNYDGTVLQSGEVPYGETPEYTEAEPTKLEDAQYTYEFAGWDPEVVPVAGEATYTAKYDEAPRLYTVTWLNYDGTEIERDLDVPYGQVPEYDGPEPTRQATAEYTYAFNGWEPAVAEVTGDATYTATYKATPVPAKTATLTFDLAGGTLNGKTGTITVEANVGDTIKLPGAPTRDGYTFKFWKGSEYAAGADYTVPEGGHEFTAEWVKDGPAPTPTTKHKVTFDANGHGKAPAAQEVEDGKAAKKPADPKASGWTFGGWYTDKKCTKAYDFSKPVTSDITLYAKWTKIKSAGSASKPSSSSTARTGDESMAIIVTLSMLAAASLCMVALGAWRMRARARAGRHAGER